MEEIPITDVLDLHPFAPRDVKIVVEEYLYQCAQKGFRFVRSWRNLSSSNLLKKAPTGAPPPWSLIVDLDRSLNLDRNLCS
jgi:hypothetical protein